MSLFTTVTKIEYAYIIEKAKHYHSFESKSFKNGMGETLDKIDSDYLDEITSPTYDEDKERQSKHQRIRTECLEDIYSLVQFCVDNNGGLYNTLPDRLFLRRVKPILNK